MNYLTVCIEQFLQSAWAQNVGWALLHSLWQITLIAALYAVAALTLRKRSASLRYLIGWVAMIAMLVVPVVTFSVLPSPAAPQEYVEIEIAVGPARTGNPDEPPLIARAQGDAAFSSPITNGLYDPDFPSKASAMFYVEQPTLLKRSTLFIQPWLPTATVVWLLGVLLLSLRPVLGCLRVQTLRSSGLTPLSESNCQLAQQLVDRLGIRHVVQFAQSALVEVPTVIGYLRPMVLLPVSSVTGLTTLELELILAHELAHIRRHDYALNLIQTVIEALLFYHPAMWWVSSHVRHERENCCDDVAVAISGDRVTYIRALAQMEEHRVAPPALSASGGSLLMRVRRLLDQPQSEFGYRKSSVWLTALILGVSLTVAAFAGTLSRKASDPPADVTLAEEDEVSGDENSEFKFVEQVGKKVAKVIRDANLPFVDEKRLKDIETDLVQFIEFKVPYGSLALGNSIPVSKRKAILSAIEKHGSHHLAIDRYQPGDLRSINLTYLELPDRLLTLKWKLYQAIAQARSFNADKQKKLESQRAWMKTHIQSLPADKFSTHRAALADLEERFADPLCCTLGYPMTDEQFRLFRGELQKYVSQKRELGHVTTHIVQQSLNSKYRDFGDFQLPFDDRVVGYGAGRFVHLSFESNRQFENSPKVIHDIESSATVIDATTGNLVTAPKKLRENKKFKSWINGQSKGDFGFDDANGGSLFTTRGAKLVKLDVRTWVEADAIGNDELKALLNGSAAKRTVSLRKYNLNNQPNKNAPYCYVGVLTKEGQIAVAAVESFGGSGPLVRSRVRSTVPSMKSAELSDEEVTISFNRPAHWLVNRDFPKSAEPTCSFRQPDSEVRRTLATMKVRFENNGVPTRQNVTSEPNPKATVHKTLTIAGEPARIAAYPIPSTSGELMTVAFGKGTRSYTLTFVYPTSQRQQYVELALAVSKSIRIRATEGEAVIEDPKNPEWGDQSDGVQLRIHSPKVQQDQGKWKVQLKTDIRANKERVLPNYGAPLDAYVLQWNGKWYRPANDNANLAASMKPSYATQRDSMHTVIHAAGWVDKSTGEPMPTLSPGQHKLRIALPLHDGPKGEAEKPRRAVSNEIEVEIVAVQPDHTLRIGGKYAQRGTVFGKVEGNVGSYSVTLEHELWKYNLGALPNIVVKSGETFEFTNVPVGECTVTANPVLVINDIKRERTYLSKTVEVKDGQTASADLVSTEIEVEAKKRFIGKWVGGGALMPVHHTFDADGSYEQRIADDLPEKGTWRLENDRLIRQIETQESTSKQIKWEDPNFFYIIEENGKTSGYHRVNLSTGKVILTKATRHVKVIDASSESQPHSLASDKPSEGSVESAVSKPLWHSSYRQHARQLADDAKKYLSDDRTGHIIDFALFSPDGYEPDLKIEVTANGTPTKIDPDTLPPKNATAHETFTVGGNVARLTARRLPADAGKPAIAEEATIEMIYGTKSIKLTLDFPIAARDYYLALFKAFAQSLKPTNTENDSAAAPPAELSARETVTQFLKQLAEGKKTINGKRGSWDHAKAYTTSGDAWTEIAGINKWSDELVKLAENQAFRPIASLGTADRVIVLASTTREKIATDEAPKVGLFDLVKKDARWLIEKMAIHQNEAAWHTVDGFTRNDDVRWEVTRADVIGEFHFNMLTCKGPVTLAEDGTWKAYLSSTRLITGTWRLEGDVLVRESIGEYTGKLITRSRIVGFFNGGFTAKNLKSEGDKVINEDLRGSVYYRTPNPPILGEDKPAQEGDAEVVQPTSDKRNAARAKNGGKPLKKDEALPGQIESGWKSVTIDDWQELFEFRVNKNQSVFGTKTFKSDANLAIGTFLDIGTVANEHGFTHLRVIQTTPAKQFPQLNIEIQAAKKGIGEVFVVEFYAKKPADSDDVMEVASLVKIAGPDRFEKKKKSHELSEKMKARYGNRYAVYEMHPNDLRKGKRIHLRAYLTKGKVKKPLGSTSLGPESYRDHSRLAVAIVDGKAVIERWGSEGYTGNAWDLKDDLNKECQALNSETDWPEFRVENKGTSQEIARNNNGWKLMVEFWEFTPKGAKKATEKRAEPQHQQPENSSNEVGDKSGRTTANSFAALNTAWQNKETETLAYAPEQTLSISTAKQYMDLTTGVFYSAPPEVIRAGEEACDTWAKKKGYHLKWTAGRAAGFSTFDIHAFDKLIGSTTVDVGPKSNWARKPTPREFMQSIYDTNWGLMRFDMGNQKTHMEAAKNSTLSVNPGKDFPLTLIFSNEDVTGILRLENYNAKTNEMRLTIRRLMVRPSDDDAEETRTKEVVIDVSENGEVSVSGKVIDVQGLTKLIEQILDSHEDAIQVFIKSNADTKYEHMTKALEAVKNGPGIDSSRVNVSLSVRTSKEQSSKLAKVLADLSLTSIAEWVTDANDIWPKGKSLLKFVTDHFPELKFIRSEMEVADFLKSLREVSQTIESRKAAPYELFAWKIRDSEFYAVFAGGKLRAVTRQEKQVNPANRMARPTDEDARAKFLAIERIARLPDEQQADQLARLYRELSPAYMNWFVEGILSSHPRNILQPKSGPYDGNTQRWGKQLADAASTMTSEQVADQLQANLWINVASRARAIYVFQRHPEATAALIASDLDSLDRPAVDRAGQAISALNLRSFTSRLVKLFIEHEELSEPIYRTLLFANAPECASPLLEQVKKDPSFLIRCSGIFQGPLNGKPADPTLLVLLNSPDAEIKFAAATALVECRDEKLAAPIVQLASDDEARFRQVAAEMAVKLPDDTFMTTRAKLMPLLKDANGPVKMAALRCFSQQHDLAAGPVILEMLKEEAGLVQDKVTVMQALSNLAGTNFNYDMHNWGTGKINTRSIEEIENWFNQASQSR